MGDRVPGEGGVKVQSGWSGRRAGRIILNFGNIDQGVVMRIESIEITKINPAKYNPRKDLRPGDPEYEKLKKSIQEFDIVEPLVWNERTGNLVGGHQRLKVLEELGHKKAEVSVVDMDEQREKALNIALNKISGEWDMPKLKDLLEDMDDGMFDMDLTGFDMAEIEDLMTQYHVPDFQPVGEDEQPRLDEKKKVICPECKCEFTP